MDAKYYTEVWQSCLHNTRYVAGVGCRVGLSMQYVTRYGQTQCRYLPTVLSAGCTPQEYYKELDMKSILPGRARLTCVTTVSVQAIVTNLQLLWQKTEDEP